MSRVDTVGKVEYINPTHYQTQQMANRLKREKSKKTKKQDEKGLRYA